MNELLCRAIREKRLLELQYGGHVRTIAPHVYGIASTGEEMLSGYQTWGGSAGGESAGWKSFKVSDLSAIKLTTKKFGPRPEYQHGDRVMAEIFCQV
jgi:hypothetical protein